ncbi:hypothetical protein [Pseudoalteromonas aurantia]|uniref:Uncharacterized protein n=1 Tax=Pseudoalteromonas aurantia TaxID=43654 RepID=A0A5S3V6G1_9GAMM|nr:hypothetical protein [Pseudoalteromonas aurantia]TMO66753.1 hypothetical protein CWC19_15555 [Pseudoalteromonas aurantia]TMO72712.1 hypothetical protein CWC20_14685 [Pseudoalteromonas aurantia]
MMEAFFTRDKANAGIKLPLYLPDGSESEHYLMVKGIDSDAFRDAETLAKRNAMTFAAIEDEAQQKDAFADEKLTLIASLVGDWSFEQACTLDEVKNFLRQAPQICDQIDKVAAKRSLFFDNGLSNSQPSPKANAS